MSDEKISEMASAGALLNGDLIPLVRLGSPNLNLSTTPAALEAFIGPSGGAGPVVTKTSNYTILVSDSQTTFDNAGASVPVTLSLPAAAPGLRYSFVASSSQVLTVAAHGSDNIVMGGLSSSAGGAVQSSVPYSTLSLIVPNGAPHTWATQSVAGAWSVV